MEVARKMAPAASVYLVHNVRTRRRHPYSHLQSPNSFFYYMPATVALATSLLILLYISSTSNLFLALPHHLLLNHYDNASPQNIAEPVKVLPPFASKFIGFRKSSKFSSSSGGIPGETLNDKASFQLHMGSHGVAMHIDKELFHDRDVFFETYKEMKKSLKIYVYPHRHDDPFANVLLPVDFEPGGNYASESYFKKVLMTSHFITKNPSTADLFFLPFSIARLRHDPRVGIDGIQNFIRDYIFNISHEYPYWNRSGGADHFYVACHSVGRSAMDKAGQVKLNVIQVVCSSSYYLSSYVAHKDASLPQIWPRKGDTPNIAHERTKLVFFAGSANSPVRQKLLHTWRNDTEISVHFGRLNTSYAEELQRSKFCLHVKGFEVNTARIGDAMYYGCVPVIIANHYDLPFQDILNWKGFSVIVATLDIPLLKKVLRGIGIEDYLILQNNVLKARKHFQWQIPAVDYDAFYMVMYELWLRRTTLRIQV